MVLIHIQGASGALAEPHVDIDAQAVGDGVVARDEVENLVLSVGVTGVQIGWSRTCVELEQRTGEAGL